MVKIKKGKSKPRSEKRLDNSAKIFIKSQILALTIYSLFFILASTVMFIANVNKSNSFYAAIAAFAASSFICGYYSGYKIHKNGIFVGLLFGLPANLLVSIISIIVNSFKIDLTAVISFAILLICSMLGGVLSVNTKLKPKKR